MEQNDIEVKESEPEKPGEDPQRGTLRYAFIYCTMFLLVLLVALEFEPMVGYRYPVLLLVVVVILLYTGSVHSANT